MLRSIQYLILLGMLYCGSLNNALLCQTNKSNHTPEKEIAASIVLPEKTVNVVLSHQAINRLVSMQGDVDNVHFSQEKNILVKVEGPNVFVKFLPLNDQQEFVQEAEIFVCVGKSVYTLIVHPKAIQAQTIYLGHPNSKAQNTALLAYKAMPLEEQAVALTLVAMKENFHEFHRVQTDEKPFSWKNSQQLQVTKLREISVEGVPLRLSEYRIASNRSQKLTEQQFLSTVFGQHLLAITLSDFTLQPNKSVNLYIVERCHETF